MVLSNVLFILGAVCVLYGLEKFFHVASKHVYLYILIKLFILLRFDISKPYPAKSRGKRNRYLLNDFAGYRTNQSIVNVEN